MLEKNNIKMIEEIKNIIISSRNKIAYEVNNTMISAYWNVGRIIVENEQNGNIKAEYGKQIIRELSKELRNVLGTGFSVSNLFNMRKFYITYPKFQTVSGKLSWSHYCELLSIQNEDERNFYEKECINSNWSVRELKRQLETSLFERLLLSDGKNNKEKVYELSKEGQTLSKPDDILKEPYVLEFLDIKEQKPILERDLERKLIKHMEDFLLELGKGFMFVGTQQRITLGNTHYYVDMVFYNKILKCYVLIDLKIGGMKPEYAGQMNMYLNYYNAEVNDEYDNRPIGIILCKNKKEVAMEYALGGLENNVFASTYTYYIPNKEQLISEVEKVLDENK
jgi:predicted nuclease of restriction endonuclease-like (RecB) superfamily